MEDHRRKISEEAVRRGITRLYHFTPLSNLASILEHGLASRRILKEANIPFAATDGWLPDDVDAVSVSIHSINVDMFAAKRRFHDQWAIVGIDASVLWTHACRFAWTNSASKEISGCRGFRGGPWAFGRMFEDRPVASDDPRSFRAVAGRADHVPTERDAEVEVVDPIPTDLIVQVIVASHDHEAAVKEFLHGKRLGKAVYVSPEDFGLRTSRSSSEPVSSELASAARQAEMPG